MAKKRVSKAKPSKKRWHIRYWPALAGGLVLLGLVAVLWLQASRTTFSDTLFEKLPKDSYLAGVARLSKFDFDTVDRLSAGTKIEHAQTAPLVSLLKRDGVTGELLRRAFDDRVSFAKSKRGNVAVFTVKDDGAVNEIIGKVQQEATDAKTVKQLPRSGQEVTVWQGTLHDPDRTVAAYRDGSSLYLGTTPEVVAAASQETEGFSTQESFTDVSRQLPAGRDAYLFINAAQMPQPPIVIPALTGIGVLNQKDSLKLSTFTADAPAAANTPPETDGNLLPDPAVAPLAIQGQNVLEYFQLLQDQRQEADLPKVIRLQNGLAAINRTLGINLQNDFFGKADGRFVYGRYRDGDRLQWFGAMEFDSPTEASSAVNDLVKRLREKVTVPVRRETVRTLTDGTQSREIVSEGKEALEISDISVEGRTGQQTVFPSIGTVSWAVDGKYLVLGSSPEAAAKMIRTIAKPSAKLDDKGNLAIQAKLADIPTVTNTSDGLFEWILSTRAQSGTFTVGKQNGELRGTVRYNSGAS